ncbi:MAG: lipopolysaccharide transport periplasmic protein LptA [Rhodocyclales bacterium]|jgi:lipopolysaccharide export system protein LptA|nr:lipopolysaccharide transport periplasmic protein LptA [Rhodocyclaceae bacterium]PWB44141.1 MAG: lipopolysaccharide transport periplasmic protein LptA [Rhodocyclales bacterium]
MPAKSAPRILLCATLLAVATLSHAEKADREKPVNLESDRATVDEINKVHIFEGNVTLTQGTLVIRSDKLVVQQDAEGFQKGIATANPGNLARFRMKREGKDEYVEGEGERIEHDAKTEITKFFNRAWVKSGQDEVRGQFIVFDGIKENYSVTSGPAGTVVPGRDSRVRAVIQPKNKAAPEAAVPGQPVRLQIAPSISNPRQE